MPADRLRLMARGFNLTGPFDRTAAVFPNEAELKRLRARGFTHVRLPLKAELFEGSLAGSAETDRRWRELSGTVDQLLRIGFAVSLDVHPGEEYAALRKRSPERATTMLKALWERLARAYRVRPAERVFFEMLNEPATEADYRLAVELAGLVRALAPLHTIVLGPTNDQRIEAMEALTPTPDENVVYAFHFYDPMAFTHQGLDWAPPSDPLTQFRGVPFPSRADSPRVRELAARLKENGRGDAATELARQLRDPWDPARIDQTFVRAEAWSKAKRRPVVVNEFGVLSWQAPAADRALWLRSVREAAERHCVGWTHWDYADGFGFMRRDGGGQERPDPPILDALVGR